jgi:hypothetical protein
MLRIVTAIDNPNSNPHAVRSREWSGEREGHELLKVRDRHGDYKPPEDGLCCHHVYRV